MDYKYLQFHNPAIVLPLRVFECAPIKGGIVTLCLQVQSETEMSVVISGGATWVYRNQFANVGVSGGYANEEDRTSYVRTMKDLNATSAEDKERFLKILGPEVMNDLAIKVLVEGDIEADSPIEAFINELKGMPNLHFY